MNKRLKSVIAFILCVTILFGICGLLAGCGAGKTDDGDLQSEYEYVDYIPGKVPEDIVDDYLESYTVWRYPALMHYGEYTKDALLYYGEYDNGVHVIYPTGLSLYFCIGWKETVAGFTFHYPDTITLDVYCDNRVYNLQEAYESGIMTRDDIKTLYQRYSVKIMLEKSNEAERDAYNKYKESTDNHDEV